MLEYAPITEIHLLQNVPLDNTYRDSLTFGTATAQRDYFLGKKKYDITECTYQRPNMYIRVNKNIEDLWDINYVMYRNPNFGTYPTMGKWFYAFVTQLEYKNPEVTHVHFEIDVLQTWYFDYTRQMSWVVREHVINDNIGANLVDEDLEHGEYIMSSQTLTDYDPSDYAVVVATTLDLDLEPIPGQWYGNVFSGVGYLAFDASLYGGLTGYLMALQAAGKIDAVACIFMYPKTMIADFESGMLITTNSVTATDILTVTRNTTTIDGYTPKNNKLFVYPYNFIYGSNQQGESAVYRYEYFVGTTCGFTVQSYVGPNARLFLIPSQYKGLMYNTEEMLSMAGFPFCPWVDDVFRNWLAQNGVNIGLGVMAGVVGVAASGITMGGSLAAAAAVNASASAALAPYGAALGMGSSALGVASQIGSVVQHSIQPPQARGNIQGGFTSFNLGMMNFRLAKMHIQAQFAERIDNYFSMFGYKVNALKVPSIWGRASWNYVQTNGCTITGHIPFNDMAKIKQCYDRGITFWHGDWVGDYSRANGVV